MNYIDRVKIDGFWGEKKVDIKFGHSENFLIGVNGSGKTTIINLTAACIEADFYTLDRITYDTITVFLSDTKNKRSKSRIIVKKEENDKTPYQNILYQIFTGKEKSFEIYLDDLEEDRIYRRRDYEHYLRFRNTEVHRKDLQHKLDELFNTSWLSIHRFRTNFRRNEERSHESLVDQKLMEFISNFTGYLNELNRSAKEETDKFQKYIFLSLLSTQTEAEIFQTLRKIDLQKEKKSLAEVYSLFKVSEADYKEKLDKYSNSFSNALQKSADDKISFDDAEYLIGMKRIHSVVQQWQKLLNKQSVIFESRDNFMKVINDLLQRKELIINERNELLVVTQSGKKFHPRHLSSGEKQLLIIFGETLLQRSQAHIFIADEPELSLHIEWQEELVKSLKVLNPFAQMIFATHSPDIVGVFQDSVIKIENCIK
ncbi:AAA family ATPase [Owenweeksia hongkongensis]|uniref:AAA family ATPase n=1 Tax=Owenweeksia hongkongensis TaxID=253245 RepID=UPI003A8EA4BC